VLLWFSALWIVPIMSKIPKKGGSVLGQDRHFLFP
jgi:hypothetical protein